MKARGITIVGASAGSGKTYRLTQDVIRAATGPSRIPLEGLVAVTYTRKAHAELAERIRQTLVAEGAFDEALRLPLAYLGTVHAACLRLLQEFALDVGLSPSLDVVSDDQDKLLRQALHRTLPVELRQRIDHLATRLELRINPRARRVDWVTPVGDIMDLARSNRIPPSALPKMAARSAQGLLRLLPTPRQSAEALDESLQRELDAARRSLTRLGDTTDKTQGVADVIEKSVRALADKEMTWSLWCKLSTLQPGASARALVTPLRDAAAQYEAHPRLHAELEELTLALFQAAQLGLDGYQEWKRERRVVDYVDMLDGALTLLADERVRAALADRLRFAVVDEFQDTSPIQLALFVALHGVAGRSVWVGDRKQCIFEYAGADPLLMDAVATWAGEQGGTIDRLSVNRRSRPELVALTNELFATALAQHGFSREEVVVDAHRDAKGLAKLTPLGIFRLDCANSNEASWALASGVARMLAEPRKTPVIDRVTGRARDLRPGDVAILVATNAEAEAVAGALFGLGIRAALAREGVLGTPEGTLIDAALRWLLDDRDSLAEATIDAVTGFRDKGAEAWLTEHLTAPRGERSPAAWHAPLAAVRDRLSVLAPSEVLDEVLRALDVSVLCARWPDPAQRVANLDALRALAVAYEDRCADEREAATIAGLVRYFDDIRTPTLQRDQILAADHQHIPADADAVVVSTYHKAKGLEWPVVVLASLDRAERRDAFEVIPESDRDTFDPDDPLAGRWIRYWPWPLGGLSKAPLMDRATSSPEGQRVHLREEKERARLLYVGFTRARDHLVLAIRVKTTKKGTTPNKTWLDALATKANAPALTLPLDVPDGTVAKSLVGSSPPHEVPTRVWWLAPPTEDLPRSAAGRLWFKREPRADALARPPFRIVPSKGDEVWPELVEWVSRAEIGTVERLPASVALTSKNIDHELLGNAVHGFLAADHDTLTPDERTARAERLLSGYGMTGYVRPETLLASSDTLRAWVRERWPRARWHREVPVEALVDTVHGTRRVRGVIDLLLEQDDELVVLDHKTFPAPSEAAWRAKCHDFIPQLATYALLLTQATGKPPTSMWIHLPVGGGMVEVRLTPAIHNGHP